MKFIASFPRSGNHFCRFVTEYLTGHATQGCVDNPSDVPICLNRFDNAPHILQHVDLEKIIGQKAHSWEQILSYSNRFGIGCSGLLLISRNPIEAIASHIRVSGRLNQIPERFDRLFEQWKHLFLVGLLSPMQTSLVWYDDLISDDKSRYTAAILEISKMFWSEVDPKRLGHLLSDISEFRAISALGKNRDWAGARSINQPADFHLRHFEAGQRIGCCEVVSRRLKETIDDVRKFAGNDSKSHSKFSRTTEVIEMLDRWLGIVESIKDQYSAP